MTSRREIRVKMHLSKENSDYTFMNGAEDGVNYTDQIHTGTTGNRKLMGQNALLIRDGESINTQEFKIPLIQNKQSSYYSTFSGQKVQNGKEESQQCNLDMQGVQTLDQQKKYYKSRNMNKTQQSHDNENHYYTQNNNSQNQKRPFQKIKMTYSIYRQYQERNYQQISSNIRPKTQHSINLNRSMGFTNQRKKQSPSNQISNFQSITKDTMKPDDTIKEQDKDHQILQPIAMKKKEIFSRNMNQKDINSSRPYDINDSYLEVLNQIDGQAMNQTVFGELSFKTKKESLINGTFDKNIYMNNSQRSQTMHRSNRLSQNRFDINGSDCSFESSRIKKSPYNNHTHLSALKSHYHHNLSQNRSQDLEIQEQIREYNKSQLQNNSMDLKHLYSRNVNSIDYQNKTELSLFQKNKKINNEKIKYHQPINTCNIDSTLIPDFNEKRQKLKQKRASTSGGVQGSGEIQYPIFITTTRKGLGLQKECAKAQLINYKSCMGQQVLKISMDDPLKAKHRIWVEQQLKFKKKYQINNQGSIQDTTGNHSFEHTGEKSFNLESMMQNQHPININHEWTPKSSILLEFQEPHPTQHHVYQNLESQGHSHHASQNQYQIQPLISNNQSQIYIQNQVQHQRSFNDRNKVIYSFKKDKNQFNKIRRASSNQTSDPDQAFKKDSRDNSRLQHRHKPNESIDKSKDLSVKVKRVSGEFTTKGSMNQLKKIDLIFDRDSQKHNSSIIQSLDNNMKISREVYPQSMSLQKSFEKIKDIKTPPIPIIKSSLSINDSRENIEEAKDINVTQISIKVSLDQKKTTQHTSLEKNNPKIFSHKSFENNNSNKDPSREGISTEAILIKGSGKNLNYTKRSLKRPPMIYDKNADLMLSDEKRGNKDDNYQINQNHGKYKSQAQKLVIKATEMKINHENTSSSKIIIRAKSANTNNRNFKKVQLISPQNRNIYKTKVLTAQSRYHKNGFQNNSSVHNSIADGQRNNEENVLLSINGQEKFIDNKMQFLIEDHNLINQFNRTFVHNRMDSKSIMSKYQGRNLENTPLGDIISSGLEQKKSQTQFIQSSNRNRSFKNQINSPDKVTIRDQISTIQPVEYKSIPNHENECDSSQIKKSIIDSTLEIDHNNPQMAQTNLILDKQQYSNEGTSNAISNQQSRTQFRATFEHYKTQISFQGKNFSNNSAGNLRALNNTQYSNQDPSTKRTVLMKHIRRTPNGYGPGGVNQTSMNIQTGEGGQRQNRLYQSNSIVQVQMIAQEDLTQKDLDLKEILEPHKNIRQLKQTDLPRHSRANPSLIKKNLDLVMKMKNVDKIMKSNGKGPKSNYNPNQTMVEEMYKENSMNMLNLQNFHINATRNSNNLSFLSMKQQEYQNSFENDLIIDVKNQRVKSQMGNGRMERLLKIDHINIDTLEALMKHQKVKIPHPLMLQSYQSQLSTIKQPAKQNNNRVQHNNNNNDETTIILDNTQNFNHTLLSAINDSQLPQLVDQFISEKDLSNEHNNIKTESNIRPQTQENLELNKSIASFLNNDLPKIKDENIYRRPKIDNIIKRSGELKYYKNTTKMPNSKLAQDRQKLKISHNINKSKPYLDSKTASKLLDFQVQGTNLDKRRDSQPWNLPQGDSLHIKGLIQQSL